MSILLLASLPSINVKWKITGVLNTCRLIRFSFPSNHLPRIIYIWFTGLPLTSFAGIDFPFAHESRSKIENNKRKSAFYLVRFSFIQLSAPNRSVRRLVSSTVCITRGENAHNAERPNGPFAEVAIRKAWLTLSLSRKSAQNTKWMHKRFFLCVFNSRACLLHIDCRYAFASLIYPKQPNYPLISHKNHFAIA